MEEITVEKRSRDEATLRLEREETARIHQENKDSEALLEKLVKTIQRLELEAEERRKTIKKEEKKIDFFPQWKTPQGVIEETEEEEQYMTIGEDGRPYIAVRMKQGGKQENEEQEWRTEIEQGETQKDDYTRRRQEEVVEEEEQFMTIGEDGRPYIAVRIRQRDKIENMEPKGAKTTNPREEEIHKIGDEEEVTIIEEEDAEMEDLIREYRKNARPSKETIQLLEYYGEGDISSGEWT